MQHYLNMPPFLAFGPTVANDPAKHSFHFGTSQFLYPGWLVSYSKNL